MFMCVFIIKCTLVYIDVRVRFVQVRTNSALSLERCDCFDTDATRVNGVAEEQNVMQRRRQ